MSPGAFMNVLADFVLSSKKWLRKNFTDKIFLYPLICRMFPVSVIS